ncbi:hypothetical protein PIB30_117605 [Stylosanthes scabra]|uniref:Uncharacterized protein n=1 Tax=Stylosanthes scabra TaxID=79078 RepID=A0ABU6R5Q3_9FABA|nr:hypothetical protein [Stylosanthes scabra]
MKTNRKILSLLGQNASHSVSLTKRVAPRDYKYPISKNPDILNKRSTVVSWPATKFDEIDSLQRIRFHYERMKIIGKSNLDASRDCP